MSLFYLSICISMKYLKGVMMLTMRGAKSIIDDRGNSRIKESYVESNSVN